MNRRAFLGLVGAGSIAASAHVSNARAHLGLYSRSAAVEGSYVNATPIRGAVTGADRTSVSVALRSPRPERVTLFAVKRVFPDGSVVASSRATSVSISADSIERIELSVGDHDAVPPATRWLYVAYAVPRDGADESYLCESNPMSTGAGGGVREVDPPASPPVPTPERRDAVGRYEMTYTWIGPRTRRWRLEWSLSKAAYAIATTRDRGFARSFDEARASPFARAVARAIVSRATTDAGASDGGEHVGRTGEALSDAERFESAVRFVQSFEYVRDLESLDAPQYHRTVEETLVEARGDCKDLTYLLAGLLSHPPFGYDVALCFQSAHVFPAVRRADLPAPYRGLDPLPLDGIGGRYVGIEATHRWRIGEYIDDPIVAMYADGAWHVYNREEVPKTVLAQADKFYRDRAGTPPLGPLVRRPGGEPSLFAPRRRW